MKLVSFIVIAVLLAGLGGIAWLAFTDVPVEQKQVVKEIPYERITDAP